MALEASMRWELLAEWILVYDTAKQHDLESFFADKPKIKEIYFQGPGVSGNAQRNRGLQQVNDGLVYFLDDDNIVHPHFWELATNSWLGHVVTFDQLRDPSLLDMVIPTREVFKGDQVVLGHIDTAMFVIDRALIGEHRFEPELFEADGIFITEIVHDHAELHIYISEVAAFYNFNVQRFPGFAM